MQMESVDDAASCILGKGWRVPSRDEVDELFSSCIKKEIIIHGIRVYKLSSSLNGNHMYLLNVANYWTSNVKPSGSDGTCINAYYFNCDFVSFNQRYLNGLIRPVR